MTEPELSSVDKIVRQFDRVQVRNPENPEQVVGRIGLVGTLYLPANPGLVYRESLGAFVDDFIDRFSHDFQWRTETLGEDSMRVRPLATGGSFASAAIRLGADAAFSGKAGSSSVDDDHPESMPGTHQIQFFIPGAKRPGEAGHLRFNLPFSWERDSDRPALLTLMRELCTILSPLHGSAGMGFVYPTAYRDVYDSGVSGAFHAAATRFPGIDATPPLVGKGELDGLPTLNWLTAVSSTYLERAGGVAAVQFELRRGPFRIDDYPGGILCQSGAAPLAGDLDRGSVPLAYRQLYRVLKPVMLARVENPFVLDGVSEDEEAMYATYARRFE